MSLRVLAMAVTAVAVPMVALSIGPSAPVAGPTPGVPPAAPAPGGGGPPGRSGTSAGRQQPAGPVEPDQTTTAAGIVVHRSVAGQVEVMVAAARGDGVTLTGSGYRSRQQQAALRMANGCPDVDSAPSSACRVPTARPGRSQHEAGLAIDFEDCGTRETACYRWLSTNAGRFGFYNFPPEAWHWSTSGS